MREVVIKFRFLDNFLREYGLTQPRFDLLVPDASPFRTILFQPKDVLNVDEAAFSCTSPDLKAKFRAFLKIANEECADLAVTPEYSCPWDVLIESFAANILPPAGKLWIFGCQSLSKADLRELQNKFPNADVVFDTSLLSVSTGNYIDPACLIFRQDNGKPTLVIQAKTHHMGVHPVEIESLIAGSHGFIVRNDVNSIFLALMICSDALNFNISDLTDFNFAHQPYLILHPQLNPSARHGSFTRYRQDAFLSHQNNKEVLCLNWAAGTKIQTHLQNTVEIKNAHSAFYSKWPQINRTDIKVEANHAGGIYYSHWSCAYATAYIFNYDEHVFDFRSSKPSTGTAPAAASARNGPTTQRTYTWDGTKWNMAPGPDDFREDILTRYGLNARAGITTLGPLDLERFSCLAAGQVTGTRWHEVHELKSLELCHLELLCRVTYSRDQPGLRLVERLERIRTLYSIFDRPERIAEIAGGAIKNARVAYHPKKYNVNLYDAKGPVGTTAFLGPCSLAEQRKTYLTSFSKIFEDFSSYRLFLWFQDGDEFECIHREGTPDFTTAGESDADITASRR